MSISHSAIEAVAPDQASLNAARKLLKQAKWSLLAEDDEKSLLWGSCQGSGATPYSVTVARADLGAKCSCPSRKFPCKHAIALMWWYADQPELFKIGEVPEFVSTWLGRRRGGVAKATTDEGDKPKSMSAVATEKRKPIDPERAAKAAARSRKNRETAISRGLDELDTWILDQVDAGLGNFSSRAQEQCRLMSQRLVDAKAGGLASWVQDIASVYFSTPQQQRSEFLITAFGQLYLLASAYRQQQSLPAPLAEDVRRHIGWNTTREDLLTSKDTERQRSRWAVLANRSISQPDRLIRQETWLCTKNSDNKPRFAVLLDFIPAAVSGGSAPAMLAGHAVDAELAFYMSATPLRAQIAEQYDVDVTDVLPDVTVPSSGIHQHYQDKLSSNPWLRSVPTAFEGELKQAPNSSMWVDTGSEKILLANDVLRALRGQRTVRGFGLYNGRDVQVLALTGGLGTWWSVPS